MVIEWAAVMGGAAMKAAASSAAGKMAGMLVEKGKAKIFPGELEKAIAAGILAAKAEDETCSPSDHLFYRCYENDRDALLAKAIEHSVMLGELQKPLEGEGNIEVACLVKVFEQVAGELKIDLVVGSLERWVTTFAVGYRAATAASIRFQVAKEQYLKQLAHRVDDVKFVGIAVSGQEVEKQEVLAQIFVMPDVREEKRQTSDGTDDALWRQVQKIDWNGPDVVRRDMSEEQLSAHKRVQSFVKQNVITEEQRSWATRDRSGPKIPAQTVLTQSKNKAVLLGAPGSGKTTLASYFALMLCEQVGNDPTQIGLEVGQDWLPVVIRIRDWVLKPELSLLKYLRWYAEESLSVKVLPIGFFEHWLESGRALILLDGLDEVVDEAQRRSVVEQIETFLGQYEDCPAVITSRPAGYRWDFFNLEAFPHYTLEPFDDKQVNTFIDHWYDSREVDKAAAKRRKEDLRSAFKGNDRIRQLATNPLLLTIVALIHRDQGDLPRQRYELYESAVKTLLVSWDKDSGKRIKLSEVLDQKIWKQADLLFILKKLAYWIHTQGSVSEVQNGTIIGKDKLVRQLREAIQKRHRLEPDHAEAEAEEFVKFIQYRTGLLNEQSKNLYAFVHKTFQECLTAEEIFKRADYERDPDIILSHFRDHLHDPHWREVLLLLVSKLEGCEAEKAISTILKANSPYEKWLHRDLLFAGWCLTEDPEGLKAVVDGLVGEILDGLVQLEVGDRKRNGGKAHEESSEIVKRLGGTAFEQNIWERLKSEEKAIDRFRLLEFQASLGQEREAIEILLCTLKDDKTYFRVGAAESLGQLGNKSSEVLTELLRLIKEEKNYIVRACTAKALAKLGDASASSKAVEILLDLLKSDDSDVHWDIMQSIGELKNSSPDALSTLLRFLKHDEFNIRSCAVDALGQMGNISPEVLSGLLSSLKDDEDGVRSQAAQILGKLGNASPEVLSGLLSSLKDDEDGVRSQAAQSLGKLGDSSSKVLNGLLSLLQDDDFYVRCTAASSLIQLGNTSPDVWNALLSLLKGADSYCRLLAAELLVQLEDSPSDVLIELLNSLNDSSPMIGSRVAATLAQLSKKSIEVLPALVQWIDRQPDDVPIGAAIDALRSILE